MRELIIDSNLINSLIDDEISRYWNTGDTSASTNQIYRALCIVLRDILLKKRNNFLRQSCKSEQKKVYYMCMEFLTGKSLRNNLYNMKIENVVSKALEKYNVKLEDLYGIEKDPGLG
ncbi:MAG: alpha-glucan phosphorylase, partial [Sedimentibacter sp.]